MKYITWEERLDRFLISRVYTPFEWGVNDCVTFATGAIESMSGMNPAFFVKGKYKSKKEALKILSRFKQETFGDLIYKIFNETPMRLLGAGESVDYGDIILANVKNLDESAVGSTAGVINLEGAMVVPGKDGLVVISTPEVKHIWRV